ncbi:MAG: hypothetical protein AB1726_07865 [Planctomycetota bacterium]
MKPIRRFLPFALALPLGSVFLVRPVPAQAEGGAAETGEAEPAAPALPPMMLRLRSGDVLWGSILAHDPEGIHFRRVDTGGAVRLSWAWLDPGEVDALRLRFGYVEAAADELLVAVDRFYLHDGTEITGLIVSRTDESLIVKTATRTFPVAKGQIAGAATVVQVPALDIYTKAELYQEKVLELQSTLHAESAEGAAANLGLAAFCERIFDYPHAVHHYKKAAALDPAHEAEVCAAGLARSELKAAQQDQVDMLAEIDVLRARRRYDRAIELLAAFPTRYPDSPLMEDWSKLKERVAKYQERDVREEVVRLWHLWTEKLARRAAREKEGYQAVIAYLDEGYAEDLRKAVAQDLQSLAPGIQPDEVQRLWDERSRGRRRPTTYGQGTWLLGEERALAVLEKEAEGEPPAEGSQEAERKKLEERLARYFRNQELAQKAKTGGEAEEDDPEKFWAGWTPAGRILWIQAYFVENSGLFRLEQVLFDNCRSCGGTGVHEILFTGSAVSGDSGGSRLIRCSTCHGIARVRRLKYR